ncbi:16S rRNA (cytosine(967)-C(5))-methyltransferase RsmB [Halalkalibacillus halophilus]|uniref:16S rRNA (cytosine(967)-C(5))-methyltransferase RsmB n=1 Tax=Halalkalibacillus halophilus TaxID=392827 RepID=UPI0004235DD0|nr:16S rRNA (cytosine(967)-C(5))-methyltransferase RsmB [Halalkalibacillus halophilus]
MSQATVREITLKILVQVGEQGGFSHIILNQAVIKNDLKQNDKGLLTELVYGTLQHQYTLDFYLEPFITNKKLDRWVRWLLRMSVYQMEYLDRVPDHAVINEAVTISKRKGHKGISGFVNGVLRSMQRKGVPSLDNIDNQLEKLSIATSHPFWLVRMWSEQYGFDLTEEMCHSNIRHKNVSIRVNILKQSRETMQELLLEEGIETKQSNLSDQGLIVTKGNVIYSSYFPNHFSIQDETSMLVTEMMGLEETDTVLDSCSAPGGKTTHIAEKMNDKGTIHAHDLHAKKIKLVSEKADELGLSSIQASALDARKLHETYDKETFDRILLDAPCSGLGVLRSKPDIKYNKHKSDLDGLAIVQQDLLQAVLPLMKQHGKIVYSTCTVNKQENEEQIKQLVNEEQVEVDPSFFEELPSVCKELIGISEYGIQIFPQDFDADGFFITRLQKKK